MQVNGNMVGMFCRLLRKHGFFRAKRKPVFFRHTLGLGGIYVEILPGCARMTVRDLERLSTFNSVSRLRYELERLDEIEWKEALRWKQHVSEYKHEDARVFVEHQMEAS